MLQLDERKTEALLFDPSKSSGLPGVLRLDQSDVPVCNFARNLGVIFGDRLTSKQQVGGFLLISKYVVCEILSLPVASVQFSSRYYLCARKSPYTFHPAVSQRFPQSCL